MKIESKKALLLYVPFYMSEFDNFEAPGSILITEFLSDEHRYFSKKYSHSCLAAYAEYQNGNKQLRKEWLLAELMCMIIREGLNPARVFQEFMKVDLFADEIFGFTMPEDFYYSLEERAAMP